MRKNRAAVLAAVVVGLIVCVGGAGIGIGYAVSHTEPSKAAGETWEEFAQELEYMYEFSAQDNECATDECLTTRLTAATMILKRTLEPASDTKQIHTVAKTFTNAMTIHQAKSCKLYAYNWCAREYKMVEGAGSNLVRSIQFLASGQNLPDFG